jgi:hypothetical protein
MRAVNGAAVGVRVEAGCAHDRGGSVVMEGRLLLLLLLLLVLLVEVLVRPSRRGDGCGGCRAVPGAVLAAVPVMPMPGRERALLLLHRGVVVVVQAVMVLQRAAG